MFQLILRDEYGQNNIIDSSEKVDGLIVKARAYVQEENMDNALTQSLKEDEWNVYFVDFVNSEDKVSDDILYSGPKGVSYHRVISSDGASWKEYDLEDVGPELEPRMYIGSVEKTKGKKEPIYASENERKSGSSPTRVTINSLKNPLLRNKGVVYIKQS